VSRLGLVYGAPGRLGVVSFWCSICILACSSAQRPPVSIGKIEQLPPDDQVGIDDTFDVRVYGENELSTTYRVASDGTIDFPLAGRISVVGLRTGDIQKELVGRLRDRFLKDPQVTVSMKEWNSRKVSVLGQVQKPGPVAYHPHMTIVDAIAQAGGFTGIASKNAVSLRREGGGKIQTRIYPVADITEGRAVNISVLPGDVVVVEERLF
jgi:protein involved in polysaccharide export with SLBB domain